jgi:hypothetical protein
MLPSPTRLGPLSIHLFVFPNARLVLRTIFTINPIGFAPTRSFLAPTSLAASLFFFLG